MFTNFFFNGGALGFFEKVVLRSRYKLQIQLLHTCMYTYHAYYQGHIVLILSITLRVKKGTITGHRILLLLG